MKSYIKPETKLSDENFFTLQLQATGVAAESLDCNGTACDTTLSAICTDVSEIGDTVNVTFFLANSDGETTPNCDLTVNGETPATLSSAQATLCEDGAVWTFEYSYVDNFDTPVFCNADGDTITIQCDDAGEDAVTCG